ncbi:hypothetical protein K466DRAFT_588161 [Polyporus arcularius HHB13444]|uniref:Uncharacterized protein n=1 Tax=Polyporus arcularius HHB13444 TaxID=1314778 RepID=A0A5C3P7Y2_9APHY|nr:hypothetical protein K466DRAFT_588161 [Polyporus arcularius HHB13444]
MRACPFSELCVYRAEVPRYLISESGKVRNGSLDFGRRKADVFDTGLFDDMHTQESQSMYSLRSSYLAIHSWETWAAHRRPARTWNAPRGAHPCSCIATVRQECATGHLHQHGIADNSSAVAKLGTQLLSNHRSFCRKVSVGNRTREFVRSW